MKKRYPLLILLTMICCIGWFAIAKIQENKTPAPGWKHYGSSGETDPVFNFWLPTYYESMDPAFVTFMMMDATDKTGSQYSSLLQNVKIVFSARDTRTNNYQPDILVSYMVHSPITKNLESTMEEVKSRIQEQPDVSLITSEIKAFDEYKTIFLVYESNFEELEIKYAHYIILDGNVQWSVLYTTSPEKYDEDLSIFEKSMQTFNTKK